MAVISKKDVELLKCLRENARATLTQISKKTKIPISTLFDKLKVYEKSLITKHTTLIDFSKLGYHTKVQFLIKAPMSTRNELKKHLYLHNKINTIYKITNGYDFLVEGFFEKINEVDKFIENIEEKFSIEKYDTHYIVEDIKKEGFLIEN